MKTQTRTRPHTGEGVNDIGTRVQRAAAVAASTVAAATTWTVTTVVFGLDVSVPSFTAGGLGADLGIRPVVVATASATLLGWVLLVLLERATHLSKPLWSAAASGAALISLAGPMSGSGVTISQRWMLITLHVIAFAIYVPLMRRTIPASRSTGA